MSEESPNLIRHEGTTAIVTMNLPRKRNPFSQAMRVALHESFNALMEDRDVKAIVLTGADNTFCSGGDISEMKPRTATEIRQRVDIACRIVRLIVRGPKPVIAAIEGNAVGAGLALAAASDYVVAAKNAKFSCAFIRVGLFPDTGILWTLPRKVGVSKARQLISLAIDFGCEEAERIGLVDRAVEPGETLDAALEIAKKYASLPPVASAVIKAAFANGAETLEQTFQTEMDCQPLLMATQDHREAVAAYMEKRKPVFSGG